MLVVENIMYACRRELQEELGVTLPKDAFEMIFVFLQEWLVLGFAKFIFLMEFLSRNKIFFFIPNRELLSVAYSIVENFSSLRFNEFLYILLSFSFSCRVAPASQMITEKY